MDMDRYDQRRAQRKDALPELLERPIRIEGIELPGGFSCHFSACAAVLLSHDQFRFQLAAGDWGVHRLHGFRDIGRAVFLQAIEH